MAAKTMEFEMFSEWFYNSPVAIDLSQRTRVGEGCVKATIRVQSLLSFHKKD